MHKKNPIERQQDKREEKDEEEEEEEVVKQCFWCQVL